MAVVWPSRWGMVGPGWRVERSLLGRLGWRGVDWRRVQERSRRWPAGVNEGKSWRRQWQTEQALLTCLVPSGLLLILPPPLVSLVMVVPGPPGLSLLPDLSLLHLLPPLMASLPSPPMVRPLRLRAGTVLSVLQELPGLQSLHGGLASPPVPLLEPRHPPLLLLVVKVLPAENILIK